MHIYAANYAANYVNSNQAQKELWQYDRISKLGIECDDRSNTFELICL